MDIKQYIESGILESYLLGEISRQERKEVECLSAIYPEIAEELQKQEELLEKLSHSLSRPVPEGHKEKVMTAITGIDQGPVENPDSDSAGPAVYMRWVVAASLVLAMFSGYQYFNQSKENEEIRKELQNAQDVAGSSNLALARDSVILRHLASPATRLIEMNGTDKYADQKARVFWNAETSKTYVVLEDLSPAPLGFTYQLWAIVDGQPLDLGVYDPENRFLDKLDLPQAEAFAITLETEGGNPTPNLEQLVVMGNV